MERPEENWLPSPDTRFLKQPQSNYKWDLLSSESILKRPPLPFVDHHRALFQSLCDFDLIKGQERLLL